GSRGIPSCEVPPVSVVGVVPPPGNPRRYAPKPCVDVSGRRVHVLDSALVDEGRAMSVLIKGGRVVTAADDYVADVFVDGERVSLIGESLDVEADRVIDASGKYLLPGGVDPHTHLDMPFGGTVTIDDVESGQTSAAFGGTTCHVDFIIQPKGATFAEAIDMWRA